LLPVLLAASFPTEAPYLYAFLVVILVIIMGHNIMGPWHLSEVIIDWLIALFLYGTLLFVSVLLFLVAGLCIAQV